MSSQQVESAKQLVAQFSLKPKFAKLVISSERVAPKEAQE